MKEQFLGINISLYVKKIDKQYKLQRHFLCDSDGFRSFP